MRTIENLDVDDRGIIHIAVNSNGGQNVSISDLKLLDDIYLKLNIQVDLKEKVVKIDEKDCIDKVILSEDEYSFIQRCLKSPRNFWQNYVQMKRALELSDKLSKLEFKEES